MSTKSTFKRKEGKVLKIKITSRPEGWAPEWVRDAWIGIELEARPKTRPPSLSSIIFGVDGILPDTQSPHVYITTMGKALKALELHNKKAYQWWKDNHNYYFQHPETEWTLDAEYCEQVS